jgi:hypothetical protein
VKFSIGEEPRIHFSGAVVPKSHNMNVIHALNNCFACNATKESLTNKPKAKVRKVPAKAQPQKEVPQKEASQPAPTNEESDED